MENTVKELNLNEMEDVSSGTVFGLICAMGVVAAGIAMALGIGFARKKAGSTGEMKEKES